MVANGMVGNGFSWRGFQNALARKPHMIGCDAGTSDYGAGPLGSGISTKPEQSVRRDLEIMLQGARQLKIPLIIGSCGIAGAAPQVDTVARIVKEIASEHGMHFRIALIYSDQDKEVLKTALAQGQIQSLGPVPALTAEAIDASSNIVAMAGAQPFIDALDGGADVILAGRCTDPAIYAAVPLRAGLPPGPVWHAARSVDKGNLATTEVSEGSPVMVSVTREGFIIEPTKEGSHCTVKSVSSLTMYENPDPWSVYQPAGAITTQFATFEQLDDRRVRVTGSRFTPAEYHTVKLEGARPVGYRYAFLVGIRDPRLIANMDDFLARWRALFERTARSLGIAGDAWHLKFRVYGRDAVMGDREPLRMQPSHEVGLLIDVVADREEDAQALVTRGSSIGAKLDPVPGIPAGGNFAAPFSPNFIRMGETYEWSVWHLMTV
ncbi:MAG: acyclic terpene utilization AtuA family protein, partial [Burkholderiaceae bacterium]|nr:acyclic terpene utilization AtuA family protein [Burkholderiaceae bacterium]